MENNYLKLKDFHFKYKTLFEMKAKFKGSNNLKDYFDMKTYNISFLHIDIRLKIPNKFCIIEFY